MISIDQNCHSLWDVLPKLQVLSHRGEVVTHWIEDIDSAFTALGRDAGAAPLRLARERFHASGGADWGAALFYTEFLGRAPVDVRDWEPLTGLKTAATAKQLGRSVEDLYDEFSPSDNWQLIGPSYVGGRHHHRVVGDLTISETAPFVRELLGRAKADMLGAMPSPGSRRRLTAWFAREEALLARLLGDPPETPLTRLYERWLRAHVGEGVRLGLTSELFSCRGAGPAGAAILETFIAHYDRASGLYNEAIEETASKLRPLRRREGELPLFATRTYEGHLVRTGVFLRDGRVLVADEAFALGPGGSLPIRALSDAGVRALAGKAALLVAQVRCGPAGDALALPHRGSLYMPTAHRLAEKLADAGLLPGALKPVVRVRFRLLDRLRSLDTPIRLPAHLAAAMGAEEVRASELGEAHEALVADARRRLEAFRDKDERQRWQERTFPEVHAEIAALDARRRELARTDPKAPELRETGKRIRPLQARLLDGLVRQIDRDTQLAELDLYDSRGAILPWCIGLGGEEFSRRVIAEAEVHEEPSTTRSP